MSTDTIERLPNTVTKCHALIRSLQVAAGEGASERISALEAERDELKELLEATKKEAEELEARVEELEKDPDAISAIEAFLDECERVGPLRYDVPQSDHSNRAIVQLHDAVGRQP
jgi:predicted nuclease with TOPRIM domain